MIAYKAGYKIDPDGVHADVLDFPGALSCGTDLDDARMMLADALTVMAETNLIYGESLPRPDPEAVDPEMDVCEPIYLFLGASHRLEDVPADYRSEFKPSASQRGDRCDHV